MSNDLFVSKAAVQATGTTTKKRIPDWLADIVAFGSTAGAALAKAANLSDLASVVTARTNLGLGSAALLASTAVAQVANNLSDLASAATARTNLGLGDAATKNTGTATGTLAAGDDSRFTPRSGSVINSVYAEYTANVDLTAQIPTDNTIPQSTEGTQVLSASITPSSATSKVRVRFQGDGTTAIAASLSAALFVNSNASASRATSATVPTAGYSQSLTLEFQHTPGATTAQTYSVRVGPNSATTARLNGGTASNYLGGVMAATLVLEEIAA